MVAVVAGSGLGLQNGSLAALGGQGQLGTAAFGRGGERVYVNAGNGNLILQHRDEFLAANGLPLDLLRTYNSQGQSGGANNWRLGYSRQITGLTGAVNSAGSTVRRIAEDGSDTLYAFDAGRGLYVAQRSAGADDTLSFDAAGQRWTWTDGASLQQERYDANGRLLQTLDRDGLAITIGYASSGQIASLQSASGETLFVDYDVAGNISQLRTVYQDGGVSKTLTRTHYGYDSANRLIRVSTDLSPADNSIADGQAYTTRYSYDGASNRIASIQQDDGSRLDFGYVLVSSDYRIQTVRDVRADGATLTTRFDYDAVNHLTTITDAARQTTQLSYDAAGQLLSLTTGGLTQSFSYDGHGRVSDIRDARGQSTHYEYDANGNRVLLRDAQGHTVNRRYNAQNQLLSETVDNGHGVETSRNVYDAGGRHLRFSLSPEGRVAEHRYDAQGRETSRLSYQGGVYANAGDATVEADLQAWAAQQDPSRLERLDTAYDLRGLVASTTRYATLDVQGNGVADGKQTVARYVYDQAGNLLQKLDGVSGAVLSSYLYDGLNRVVSTRDARGAVTTTVYGDAQRQTAVTLANGLTTITRYDAAGQAISVSQQDAGGPLGSMTTQYNAKGLPVKITDANGAVSYLLYDGLGRKVGQIDAELGLIEWLYNANGQVTRSQRYANRVDAAKLQGDPAGWQIASLRPAPDDANDRFDYQLYNALGQLAQTIDASGAVTRCQYDNAGRLTATLRYATRLPAERLARLPALSSQGELDPSDAANQPAADAVNDRVSRQFYDRDGLLVGSVDGEGYLTESRYDGAGHVAETIRYATRAGAGDTLDAIRPQADAQDQRVRNLYDSEGRLVGQVDAEGYLDEVIYDARGRKQQTIRYATRAGAGATLAQLRPVPSGQDRGMLYQYDDADQLIRQQSQPDGLVTLNFYDDQGHLIRSVRDAGNGDVRSQLKRYDSQGRLTGELGGEGAQALSALGAAPSAEQVDALWRRFGTVYQYNAGGQRIAALSPNGEGGGGDRTAYVYDGNGKPIYTVNSLGEVTEVRYNAFGEATDTRRYATRLSSAQLAQLNGDPRGSLSSLTRALQGAGFDALTHIDYNRLGQRISQGDALNANRDSWDYNAFGEAVGHRQRLDAGRTTLQLARYDRLGRQVGQTTDTEGLGLESGSGYDAFGRLTDSTDANGNVSHRDYDKLGRQIATQDAQHGKQSAVYDAFGRELRHIDALGHSTVTAYDDAAGTVTVTSPGGIQTISQRDRYGETVKLVDGRGNATTYQYNRDGQLLATATPAGVTRSAYDSAGQLIRATDARGVPTIYRYDAAGRVLSRTVDPDGLKLTTQTSYDALGRTLRQTDAGGRVTENRYDAAGRLQAVVVDPDGLKLTTTYDYDAQGQQIRVTTAAGTAQAKVTEYHYDGAGRRVDEIVDPDGLKLATRYQYDSNGNVVAKIDAAGHQTRYVYDAGNRLRYSVDALGQVTRTDYNAAGQAVASTRHAMAAKLDSLGVKAQLTEADLNAWLQTSAADQTSRTLYDAEGRSVYSIDALGYVTERQYDAAGNVTATVRYAKALDAKQLAAPDALTAGNLAGLLQRDPADQTARTIYDAAGRATFSIDALGYVTERQYDAAGNVVGSTRYAKPLAANLVASPNTLDGSWQAEGRTVNASDAGFGTAGNAIRLTNRDSNATAAFAVKAGEQYHFALDAIRDEGSERAPAALRMGLSYSADGVNWTQWVAAASADPGKAGLQTLAGDLTIPAGMTYARVWLQIDAPYNQTSRWYVHNVQASRAGDGWRADGLDDAGLRARLLASPADQTARTIYDAAGRATFSVDALGYVTERQYDAAGNVAATVRRAKALDVKSLAGSNALDDAGLRKALPSDPADQAARTIYDAAGRATFSIDALGNVTERQYDAAGNVAVTVRYAKPLDAKLLTSAGALDDASLRKALVSDSADVATRTLFDPAGRVTFSVDALGYVTERQYDAAGNVTATVRYAKALDAKQLATPDALTAGNLAGLLQRGPADQTARTIYDAAGRATFSIDALGYVTERQYDAAGNVVGSTRYAKPLAANLVASPNTLDGSWQAEGRTVNASDAGFGTAGNAIRLTNRDSNATAAFAVKAGEQYHFALDAIRDEGSERAPAALRMGLSYSADGVNWTQWVAAASADPGKAGLQTLAGDLTIPAGMTYARVWLQIDAPYNQTSRWYVHNVQASRAGDGWRADGLDDAGLRARLLASPADQIVRNDYDNAGRLLAVSQGDGKGLTQTARYELDAFGNRVKEWDGNQHLTVREFDVMGRIHKETHGEGDATVTDYDAFGNAVKITDPRGNAGYFYFDALGRRILQVDPEGYATRTDYDSQGNVCRITRYAGRVDAGALQAAVPPQPPVDAQHDQVSLVEHDALGRQTRLTDAEGGVESMVYDAFGNKVQYINQLGGVFTYRYDGNGRVLTETGPADAAGLRGVKRFEYDANGNRTLQVEADGRPEQRTTRYEYDGQNRLVKQTGDAVKIYTLGGGEATASPVETRRYDAAGNLVEFVDANGNVTRTAYDSQNRKVAERNGDGVLTQWAYDAAGNVVEQRVYATAVGMPSDGGVAQAADGNCRVTRYVYDQNNRLTQTLTPQQQVVYLNRKVGDDNGDLSNYDIKVRDLVSSRAYDANGNVVKDTDARGNSVRRYYDKGGRKLLEVDAAGYAVAWDYDNSGKPIRETRYANAVGVPADGDTLAQVRAKLQANAGDDRVSEFDYDRLGRVMEERRLNVQLSGDNGVSEGRGTVRTQYRYNALGKATQKIDAKGGVTDIAYDAIGREIHREEAAFIDQTGQSVRPATDTNYNGLDQALQVRKAGVGGVFSETHYAAGGLADWTRDAEGNVTYYDYDAAGNITRTRRDRRNPDGSVVTDESRYSYTAAKQQTVKLDVGSGIYSETRYNAYGQVEAKRTSNNRDGAWQEFSEYDGAGRLTKGNAGGVTKLYGYDANGNATMTVESGANAGDKLRGMSLNDVLNKLGDVRGANYRQDLNDYRLTLSDYDARNQHVATYQPRIANVTDSPSVQIKAWEVAKPLTNGGDVVSVGPAPERGVSTANPAGMALVSASRNDEITGTIQSKQCSLAVQDPQNHRLDQDLSVRLRLPGSLEALGTGQYRVKVYISIQYFDYNGKPVQTSAPLWGADYYHDFNKDGQIVSIDQHLPTVVSRALFDAQMKAAWQRSGEATFRYDVEVYKRAGNEELLISHPAVTSYRSGGNPIPLVGAVENRNFIYFRNVNANANRLLMLTRPVGSNAGWLMSSPQPLVLNGHPQANSFAYDWSGLGANNYEYRYLALGADGSIVESQQGTINLGANPPAASPSRDAEGRYLPVDNTFMHENGVLSLTNQAGAAAASIRFRHKGESGWGQSYDLKPMPLAGWPINGWIQFNPAYYGLGADMDWEYQMERFDTAGRSLGLVRGGFHPGNPTSVTQAVSWSDQPQIVHLQNQSLLATNGVVLYRPKGSNAGYAQAQLVPSKSVPGQFDWDTGARESKIGDNLLANPLFGSPDAKGVPFGWQYASWRVDADVGSNLDANWKMTTGMLTGENTVYLHQTGRDPLNGYQQLMQDIDIQPGRRYAFSAYTGAHRALVSEQIIWLDAKGQALSNTSESMALNNDKVGGNTLDGYKRLTAQGVAPEGAVRARVVLRKYNTDQDRDDSWLFATRTQFEEIPADSQQASDWKRPVGDNPPGDYEFEYRLFDANGAMINRLRGNLSLGQAGQNGPVTIDANHGLSLPLYVQFDPKLPAAARMDLTSRIKGSGAAWQDSHVSRSTNGNFLLNVDDWAVGDYEYTYRLRDADGNLLKNADGAVVEVSGYIHRGNSSDDLKNEYLQWVVDKSIQAATVVRRQSYNAFGEVASETDGVGNVTRSDYSTAGKLLIKHEAALKQRDDGGAVLKRADGGEQTVSYATQYRYDAMGNLVSTQDARGNANRQQWLAGSQDGQGKVIREDHADGSFKDMAYDQRGNLRTTTENGARRTDYSYDQLGRLKRVDRVQRADGSRGYDEYDYDSAGQRIAHRTTDGKTVFADTTAYDSLGRVLATVSAAQRTVRYSYQWDAGLLGAGGAVVGGWRATTINANGLTMVDSVNLFGLKVRHVDLGNHSFNYLYNDAGQVASQNGSTGQNIVYTYYGNGYLQGMEDRATHSYTMYGYDDDGRKTYEGYATGPDRDHLEYYQQSNISYDEMGRVIQIKDPKFLSRYQYDAAGNRQRVYTEYSDGKDGSAQSQDNWYTYDAMNRFLVSMGSKDAAGNIVAGSRGVSVQYDQFGQRQKVFNGADGTVESYDYTADGYLTDTKINDKLAFHRVNDLLGRVTDYASYDWNHDGKAKSSNTHTEYDRDNKVTRQVVDGKATRFTLLNDGTLDHSVLEDDTTVTTYYGYEWWDDAKQSTITSQPYNSNAPGWRSGFSHMTYDVNGHLEQAIDEAGHRTLRYVNDAQGVVLKRQEYDRQVAFKTQSYYYVDGKQVGAVGNDGPSRVDFAQALAQAKLGGGKDGYRNGAPASSADFDQNYEPIGPNYPAQTPGSVTAKDGDTLQSLAAGLWGDKSLWYLLADANALTGSEKLAAGQILRVPNKVTNIHNNSGTYRVYNPGEAIGDTSPTLPTAPPPPPPPGGGGCGTLAMIIIVVIVVIVANVVGQWVAGLLNNAAAAGATTATTVGTAGTTAGTAAGTTAGTAAGTAAGSGAGSAGFWGTTVAGSSVTYAQVAGAVVGGAAGSIAGQGAAMAMGMQQRFSWQQVGMAALTAGAMRYTGGVDIIGGEGKALNTVAQAMAGSTLSQGLSMAVGAQKSFNWTAVAASGVAEWATGNMPKSNVMSDPLVYGVTRGMIGGTLQSVLGEDHRPNWSNLAIQSFGSALGDLLTKGSVQSAEQNQQNRPLMRFGSADAYDALGWSGASGGRQGRSLDYGYRQDDIVFYPDAPGGDEEPRQYIIRKGDTLSKIGRKVGSSAAELALANPKVNPLKMAVGAPLDIPEKGAYSDEQIAAAGRYLDRQNQQRIAVREAARRQALLNELREKVPLLSPKSWFTRDRVEEGMYQTFGSIVAILGSGSSTQGKAPSVLDGALESYSRGYMGTSLGVMEPHPNAAAAGEFVASGVKAFQNYGLDATGYTDMQKARASWSEGSYFSALAYGVAGTVNGTLTAATALSFGLDAPITESARFGFNVIRTEGGALLAGVRGESGVAKLPQWTYSGKAAEWGGAPVVVGEKANFYFSTSRLRETGAVGDLLYGARTGEGLPGSAGVAIPSRPMPVQLANLTEKHGVEFAVTYKYGPGPNGGGGQYYLYSGVRGEVEVPISANEMLIYHTHPSGTAFASQADMDVLNLLKLVGSPQRSSQIVPVGKDVVRFGPKGWGY